MSGLLRFASLATTLLGTSLGLAAPTLVSARRSFTDHTKVTVIFSEPVEYASATQIGNYALPSVTIRQARREAELTTVILTTSALPDGRAYALTVNGVRDFAGHETIAPNSRAPVSLQPLVPTEMGTTVNGFQDDFDDSSRNPLWQPIGPDVYTQTGGRLNVSAGGGDPNHLVYANPASQGTVQEILARIKVVAVTSHEHAFGGLAVGVPLNSLSLPVKGGMNVDFHNPGAFGGPARGGTPGFLASQRVGGPTRRSANSEHAQLL